MKLSKKEKNAIRLLNRLNKVEEESTLKSNYFTNLEYKDIRILLAPENFGIFNIILKLIEKQNKKIKDVKDYLEYYLIGNVKYKESQEEFKRLLKILESE